MPEVQRAALIIPFHNEENRLSLVSLEALLQHKRFSLYLVDDGSRDATYQILNKWQIENNLDNRVTIIKLLSNVGKANAVRLGMRRAVADGFEVVGQMDADASIGERDLLLGLDLIQQNECTHLVSGARVRLAGSSVLRNPARLWLGRIIATFIFLITRIPMYDPQSPLKWWRFAAENSSTLDSPLETFWFGEVELIIRLSNGEHKPKEPQLLREFPIEFWIDDAHSHFGNLRSYLRVISDLRKLLVISWQKVREKRRLKKASGD